MSIERMRERLAADPASFIEPCLPSPAPNPPAGLNWIHEVKHDGFRLMARRDPVGIRLITRRGYRVQAYSARRGTTGAVPPASALVGQTGGALAFLACQSRGCPLGGYVGRGTLALE